MKMVRYKNSENHTVEIIIEAVSSNKIAAKASLEIDVQH